MCAQMKKKTQKKEGNCLVIVCGIFRNKTCEIYAIPD